VYCCEAKRSQQLRHWVNKPAYFNEPQIILSYGTCENKRNASTGYRIFSNSQSEKQSESEKLPPLYRDGFNVNQTGTL
jgi:hypothetical protein